jgi:hypothetical protein
MFCINHYNKKKIRHSSTRYFFPIASLAIPDREHDYALRFEQYMAFLTLSSHIKKRANFKRANSKR